jgi:hypothetical protein
MLEMLKPCIDEGFVIQERIVSNRYGHHVGAHSNRLVEYRTHLILLDRVELRQV